MALASMRGLPASLRPDAVSPGTRCPNRRYAAGCVQSCAKKLRGLRAKSSRQRTYPWRRHVGRISQVSGSLCRGTSQLGSSGGGHRGVQIDLVGCPCATRRPSVAVSLPNVSSAKRHTGVQQLRKVYSILWRLPVRQPRLVGSTCLGHQHACPSSATNLGFGALLGLLGLVHFPTISLPSTGLVWPGSPTCVRSAATAATRGTWRRGSKTTRCARQAVVASASRRSARFSATVKGRCRPVRCMPGGPTWAASQVSGAALRFAASRWH